jgi:hypothetical protein
MQLTRLDRWLLQRFVHETQIYTMREPDELPAGVRHEEIPEKPGQKYKHLYSTRSTKKLDLLLDELKKGGQMFTTRVIDRPVWYAPILGPKGKSVTWWIFWKIIGAFVIVNILITLKSLWDNPVVRENVMDSIRIFKG